MGELRDDVGPDEPLAAHRHVGVDAVRLHVDPSRAVVAPHLGRGRERRARSDGHVERVERLVAGAQLGIEAHPAAADVRLDDHVVVVPLGAEVGREADAAPCGDPVLAQRADAEQRVVAATALDPIRERPLDDERLGVPALIRVEDSIEPAQVDVGAGLGRQVRPVRPVVRDHVAGDGAEPGGRRPGAPRGARRGSAGRCRRCGSSSPTRELANDERRARALRGRVVEAKALALVGADGAREVSTHGRSRARPDGCPVLADESLEDVRPRAGPRPHLTPDGRRRPLPDDLHERQRERRQRGLRAARHRLEAALPGRRSRARRGGGTG